MTIDRGMLEYLGLESTDELFAGIQGRMGEDDTPLSKGMTEREVLRTVGRTLSANVTHGPCFMGGSARDHFVPSAVRTIVGRGEFMTSYTPYQPEISQGMLQAQWEYQSLMAELVSLDVVNASMYDWSTALGEAARMCHRANHRPRFLVPEALEWNKRFTLDSYSRGAGIVVETVRMDRTTGKLDIGHLDSLLDEDVGGVYVETPNLFGVVDDGVLGLKSRIDKALLVVGADPLSMALLRGPGDYGADIVVGEGQWLGSSMSCGGPMLGVLACDARLVRKMPGRLIGRTVDAGGDEAYTMTLQTREQHIRRERATSNICSNEALNAVGAAAYLALMGSDGLRGMMLQNLQRARALASRIDALDGYEAPMFPTHHLNEFAIRTPIDAIEVNERLADVGIVGGNPMSRHVDGFEDVMVLTVTENQADEDHDRLVEALGVLA